MTLKQFRRATANLPSETEILVLDPWGNLEAAALVQREDLAPGDPVLEDLRPGTLCICADADVALNFTLTEQAAAALA